MSRAFPALLAAILLSPAAASGAAGETWENTTEMQMKGIPFALPPTTVTICKPVGSGWEEPPRQSEDDPGCKTTVLARTASSLKWKMVCTGERKMDGEGEMSWTPSTYAGSMKMRAPEGEMSMKLKGKKLGKACDPEEQEREAQQMMDRMEAQQAQSGAMICESAVESMSPGHFTGSPPLCADKVKRDEFCERARTRDGLEQLRARGVAADLGTATKLCKLDVAKLESRFCEDAAREEDLEYVGEKCPALVPALAKRECAGRTYTDVRSSYRSFCTQYAADQLAKPQARPASGTATDAAKETGKKLLKGVFGL